MGYKVEFTEGAAKDIDRLDPPVRKRLNALIERIGALDDPRSIGKALQGPLRGKWGYRSGDWRMVAEIIDLRLIVIVVSVDHRSEAY